MPMPIKNPSLDDRRPIVCAIVITTVMIIIIAAVDVIVNDTQYLCHAISSDSGSAVPSSKKQIEACMRVIEVCNPDLIVDVGCGVGDILEFLCKQKSLRARLVGIELESVSAVAARARAPCATIENKDMLDYRLPTDIHRACIILYEPLFQLDDATAVRMYKTFFLGIEAERRQQIDVIYISRASFILAPRQPIMNHAFFTLLGYTLVNVHKLGSFVSRRQFAHYRKH